MILLIGMKLHTKKRN